MMISDFNAFLQRVVEQALTKSNLSAALAGQEPKFERVSLS